MAWDTIETLRPALATAVFDYAAKKVFERADFASQDGIVRLSSWIARECAAIACKTAPLTLLVVRFNQFERIW